MKKSLFNAIIIGIGTTLGGLYIKEYLDNQREKPKNNELTEEILEKAYQYDSEKTFNDRIKESIKEAYERCETFLTVYEEKPDVSACMGILNEACRIFRNSVFLYEDINYILDSNIDEEEKLKMLKSFITHVEDLINKIESDHLAWQNSTSCFPAK